MNNIEKLSKALHTQKRYTKEGEAVGAIARIDRTEMCIMAGFDSADNLNVRFLKEWFAQRGEVLQPYYTSRYRSGDGTYILSKGDLHQRAADDMAMNERHQGEKDLHSEQDAIAIKGIGGKAAEFCFYQRTIAEQHVMMIAHSAKLAAEAGLNLTDSEVEAIVRAA